MQELENPVETKHIMFKESFSAIGSFLQRHSSSASTFLKKSLCSVMCLVATILKTIYTSPRSWNARVRVLQQDGNNVVSNDNLSSSIAPPPLPEVERPPPIIRTGHTFERNLVMNDDVVEPVSLMHPNLRRPRSSRGQANDVRIRQLLTEAHRTMMARFQETIRREAEARRRSPHPSSKKVILMLPITFLTEEILLAKFDEDSQCCICLENFIVNDAVQDLPCNHTFHHHCLESWLDAHNRCPICRHELETDDLMYGNYWENVDTGDVNAANASQSIEEAN
ncbi:E3 ubiquitin-protein ligase AIP2-like [Primulina huaijiensis]|uniref:E3 ubiquitin-protein ligase AIP2-like n=1 Tax=Primulina huaijiensis TaxID=1492673 RepID=UPI003CC6E379